MRKERTNYEYGGDAGKSTNQVDVPSHQELLQKEVVDTLKSDISQTNRHALSGEMEGKPWKVVDFQRKETDGQSFLSLMTYCERLSYSIVPICPLTQNQNQKTQLLRQALRMLQNLELK